MKGSCSQYSDATSRSPHASTHTDAIPIFLGFSALHVVLRYFGPSIVRFSPCHARNISRVWDCNDGIYEWLPGIIALFFNLVYVMQFIPKPAQRMAFASIENPRRRTCPHLSHARWFYNVRTTLYYYLSLISVSIICHHRIVLRSSLCRTMFDPRSAPVPLASSPTNQHRDKGRAHLSRRARNFAAKRTTSPSPAPTHAASLTALCGPSPLRDDLDMEPTLSDAKSSRAPVPSPNSTNNTPRVPLMRHGFHNRRHVFRQRSYSARRDTSSPAPIAFSGQSRPGAIGTKLLLEPATSYLDGTHDKIEPSANSPAPPTHRGATFLSVPDEYEGSHTRRHKLRPRSCSARRETSTSPAPTCAPMCGPSPPKAVTPTLPLEHTLAADALAEPKVPVIMHPRHLNTEPQHHVPPPRAARRQRTSLTRRAMLFIISVLVLVLTITTLFQFPTPDHDSIEHDLCVDVTLPEHRSSAAPPSPPRTRVVAWVLPEPVYRSSLPALPLLPYSVEIPGVGFTAASTLKVLEGTIRRERRRRSSDTIHLRRRMPFKPHYSVPPPPRFAEKTDAAIGHEIVVPVQAAQGRSSSDTPSCPASAATANESLAMTHIPTTNFEPTYFKVWPHFNDEPRSCEFTDCTPTLTRDRALIVTKALDIFPAEVDTRCIPHQEELCHLSQAKDTPVSATSDTCPACCDTFVDLFSSPCRSSVSVLSNPKSNVQPPSNTIVRDMLDLGAAMLFHGMTTCMYERIVRFDSMTPIRTFIVMFVCVKNISGMCLVFPVANIASKFCFHT